MDNMREVEMRTKEKAAATAANESQMGSGDRKKLKKLERAVQYAERKIEELESKIAAFEKKMGETGFYQSTDSQKVLDDFGDTKRQLETAMEEWESATEKLEKLG